MTSSLERLLHEVREAQDTALELEIRRLLPMWVSEVGPPHLVFGPGWRFLGLGPAEPMGAVVRIFIPAREDIHVR